MNKPIRILHINPNLTISSGVINFIMSYYRNINRKYIQFDFLYFKSADKECIKEIEELGGRVFRISSPEKKNFNENYKDFLLKHRNEFIAIHCHPIFGAFFFGKMAKRIGIKYIIQHSHTSRYGSRWFSSVRNHLLLHLGSKYVTHYIGCSRDALKLIPSYEISRKPYYIFTNAIDLSKFSFRKKERDKIRRKYNISDGAFVIGNVGRFSPEKNHIFLIKSFKLIKSEVPSAVLLLFGDGSLLAKIKKIARQSGVGDAIIFGGTRNDINYVYSAFDVFILPSVFEGLGRVAIEAQTSGLPTLCSTHVSSEADVSNLFFQFRHNDFHEVLDDILLLKKRGISLNSRKTVRINDKYDIVKQAAKLEDFYISLL